VNAAVSVAAMGLFKQMKDARKAIEATPALVDQSMKMAAQAQEMSAAQQAAQQAAPPPQPGLAAGAADLEPIAGVSLELFATVCKELAGHGYDQSKAPALAAAHGVPADSWQAAQDGWNVRVKTNPAVAQQFSTLYHGS
jgi:hypothetical protein